MERSTGRLRNHFARKLIAAALSLAGAGVALAQDIGYPSLGYEPIVAAPLAETSVAETERLYTLDEVRSIVREEIAAERSDQERFSSQQKPYFEASAMADGQPAAAAPAAEASAEPKRVVVGSDSTLTASWRNGIEIESADKAFKMHLGGRTQFDGTWYQADNDVQFGAGGIGELQDAVNFRRARFRADGVMYEVIEFAAEYDFANQVNVEPADPPTNATAVSVPAVTDLWIAITKLPCVGNFKVGHFKEAIGLEHLTSSRWLDFMERSFLQDAFWGPFNNGFSPGAAFYNWTEDERATWNIGAYKNASNIFGSGVGDGEYAVTGRLTWLPYYENEGRQLLHVGISGSHRDLDQGAIRFRSRASLRAGNPGPFNPILADTGTFLGDSQDLMGLEGLAILGPWQFQAEYATSWVDDANQGGVDRGTVNYHGYYAECLYFLTGENRPYNRKAGVPDRIVPFTNYFFVKSPCGPIWGHGAWQIGVRYSWLDLRDAGIDGGIIQDVTCGLNWFLNPNFKLQWNYIATYRDAPGGTSDGDIHGFGMRAAYDF